MNSAVSFLVRAISIAISLFVLRWLYRVGAGTYLLVMFTHIIWGVCGAVERKQNPR